MLFKIIMNTDRWWTLAEQAQMKVDFGTPDIDFSTTEPKPHVVEEGKGHQEYYVTSANERIAHWQAGDRKLDYGVREQLVDPIVIRKYLPCTVVSVHGVVGQNFEQVAAMQQRHETPINDRVQVITPGVALQSYDHVMNYNDLCTDILQGFLDEGWRILAICVQPDQRRPDYILGRNKKG